MVRINADARAEGHRARMMREADEHAKALALAVTNEEICACRLVVPLDAHTFYDGFPAGLRSLYLEWDARTAAEEVDHLRATAPKVPSPRPGAERFEAPLVRDKATARAMGNKYANAPAGTRAAHKRTPPPADWLARTARRADREERQRFRREVRRWSNSRKFDVVRDEWGGLWPTERGF